MTLSPLYVSLEIRAQQKLDLDWLRPRLFVEESSVAFERSRINELADRFPRLRERLLAINTRIFDLMKVASQCYYHPSQHGSWSIKAVLPTIAPELSYELLGGLQDGGMAMEAYLEAIHPDTEQRRKDQIRDELLAYCHLDTFAMVRLWEFFSGN